MPGDNDGRQRWHRLRQKDLAVVVAVMATAVGSTDSEMDAEDEVVDAVAPVGVTAGEVVAGGRLRQQQSRS